MDIGRIQQGKIESEVNDDCAATNYVRWAPGTGFVYQMLVVEVGREVMERLGGDLMITLECAGHFVTQFFGANIGLWHESLVQEHFNWNKKMTEKEVLLYTAMLNWTLGYGEVADEYAKECWNRAGVRKRAVRSGGSDSVHAG